MHFLYRLNYQTVCEIVYTMSKSASYTLDRMIFIMEEQIFHPIFWELRGP